VKRRMATPRIQATSVLKASRKRRNGTKHTPLNRKHITEKDKNTDQRKLSIMVNLLIQSPLRVRHHTVSANALEHFSFAPFLAAI
jgi:hypothetical protein